MNRKLPLATFLLTVILLLALAIRLNVAFAFRNLLGPDEILQTLEPAHRLTYGYGIVTWEFREGIRSWVFPGILAGVMRLTDWMGDGSTGYLAGISIFLCLLSLSTVLVAFLWGYRVSGIVAAILSAGACGVWLDLIYFAPKALNEVVATHFFLPGLYLGVYGRCFQPRTRLFVAGLLCGFALALRIQLTPAVVLAVAYICRKDWREKWVPMTVGILGPILAFGLVDAFTWSYPFQSFWLNVWVNIVAAKSQQYGVSPWYTYLSMLKNGWSWALVPIALLVILGARRSPILVWLAFAIVLSHSAIGHKEYRFIYPAVCTIVLLAGLGTAELLVLLGMRLSSRWIVTPVLVCLLLWTSTSGFLAWSGPATATRGGSTTTIAPQDWKRFSSNLLASQSLSQEKTLCGVGLRGIAWFNSAGYTYLHQNVPIFLIEKETNFDELAPSFNYLVSRSPVSPQHSDYKLQKCWGTACTFKRPGSCAEKPGYQLNQVLKQRGL